MTAATATSLRGSRFPPVAEEPYEILGQLGRGHFGAVYEARHRALGWAVALKLIPVRTTVEVVLEEARKLAALPLHDNVVQVLDAGPWSDCDVYIASELCLEGSLGDRAGTPLDPATACGLVSDACRGLDHLHQHDLLHLDIRPANILLSDGRPRLADFGLARWSDDADVEDWYGPHAAPELVESGRATVACDVFSMAMTLAHLLTGGTICRPFPVNAELVQASADGDWPRLDELGPHIPPRLRKLLEDATQYDYDARPSSVAEFKRALDRATPAVALMPTADGALEGGGGEWSISTTPTATGRVRVDVRRNGRRRAKLAKDGLTDAQGRRYVTSLVRRLANGEL